MLPVNSSILRLILGTYGAIGTYANTTAKFLNDENEGTFGDFQLKFLHLISLT
uniref:Uncharacterized protein n=1 Tax=Rhizophora mucronata TaxID=61149 RepID=A0A2P2NEQ9_RHIMU